MATYWEIAAHSDYDTFSWFKCLIVSLVFSHLGFWSGNLLLNAPFPDFSPKFFSFIQCHLYFDVSLSTLFTFG